MGDVCSLAAELLMQQAMQQNASAKLLPPTVIHQTSQAVEKCAQSTIAKNLAIEVSLPEFSPTSRKSLPNQTPPQRNSVLAAPSATPESSRPAIRPRPASGSQLYQQRLLALRAGRTYTRLPSDSFREQWLNATEQPTYEQWVQLLRQEAIAMSRGQGNNRLTVLLGDSLYLWYPSEKLGGDRFWLNQGISGDTSTGVLRRLDALANTRPDTIHVMVGINDLRRGKSDAEIVANLHQIMRRLRQAHPTSQVIVHSLLPTRLPSISPQRIDRINQALAYLAHQERVVYLDIHRYFADANGNLRLDLTTDGLHLNQRGYAMWARAGRIPF